MNYKAVFIDWDDTIGDWKGAEDKALRDLYAAYGFGRWFADEAAFKTDYEVYNKTLWEQYGRGEITKQFLHRERFLHTLREAKEITNREALADEMGDRFLQLTNKYFSVLPGAAEVVRELAKKYPLTIISNGFKEVQYYKFAHSGLAECFAHTIISEEVGINKPQPGIFQIALEKNGVGAEEAIMIGDSYSSDIQGAKNAGIDQIWLHQGEVDETATYIVSELSEVFKIL